MDEVEHFDGEVARGLLLKFSIDGFDFNGNSILIPLRTSNAEQ
jgi:hypothetical protein